MGANHTDCSSYARNYYSCWAIVAISYLHGKCSAIRPRFQVTEEVIQTAHSMFAGTLCRARRITAEQI